MSHSWRRLLTRSAAFTTTTVTTRTVPIPQFTSLTSSPSTFKLFQSPSQHHHHHTLRFFSTQTTRAMSNSDNQNNNHHMFKLAMCQLSVGSDKRANIDNALHSIRQSAAQGAHLIVLPECFNSPYGTKYFAQYAEELDSSETLQSIAQLAQELNVYIIAGSIPTRATKNSNSDTNDDDDHKYYNTSVVFDNEGKCIATHHKVHLFDVNVPNRIVFQESAVLSAGHQLTTFDMVIPHTTTNTTNTTNTPTTTDGDDKRRVVKVGLGICFDIRFPEMAQLYQRMGCELLVYPGAFNMTTGPAHWELLCRARAVDNQVFVSVVSPARDTSAEYVAYGHSMTCSPWGHKLAEMDEKAGVLTVDVPIDQCMEIRDQIPSIKNKRTDLYDVVLK